MTLGFEQLEVGDSIEFKGPLGSFKWLGQGVAECKGVRRDVRKIGMICAGSGKCLFGEEGFRRLLVSVLPRADSVTCRPWSRYHTDHPSTQRYRQ